MLLYYHQKKKKRKRFDMEKKWLRIGLFAILLFQIGCVGNRTFFRDKILIYSQEYSQGSEGPMLNSSYIDFYRDTINNINSPFTPFDDKKTSKELTNLTDTSQRKFIIQNIYPYSNAPFKFDRIGKTVYINYISKGKSIKKEYFRLSSNDSVKTSSFNSLCDANVSYNWVVTRYTGRDTVLVVAGKKVNCWIFNEQYPHIFSPAQRSQIIYLGKKTLLPIQIIETHFKIDSKDGSIIVTETFKSKIDSIVRRPWDSSDRKWQYPPCYSN